MWHRRSLIPNLASSDLRISEGWLLLQLIMVLPLIWSTGWVCWYVLERSLALMIIMTVEGQRPRFVVSTATNWTLRSPQKMNYASHIINVAVHVNAGWKNKDLQYRRFMFIYFSHWWRRSWSSALKWASRWSILDRDERPWFCVCARRQPWLLHLWRHQKHQTARNFLTRYSKRVQSS